MAAEESSGVVEAAFAGRLPAMSSSHVFRRYGGSLQVTIDDFAGLVAALDVAEPLWVATACPMTGLSCDPKLLTFLDTDKNERIRIDELKSAVRWTAEMLDKRDGCDQASDTLVLDHLSEKAATLRKTAEMILKVLGVKKKQSISLAQIRESDAALRAAGINGDGIVAPETAPDEELQKVMRTIMATAAPLKNRADKEGVSKEMIAAFREGKAKGLARLDAREATLVWGEASLDRAKTLRTAAPRLDEYFVQCRIVAAQPEAASQLKLGADRVAAALGDRDALVRAAVALPIAPPNPEGTLRFSEMYRGAYAEFIEAFRKEVLVPALGERDHVTEAEFRDLAAKAGAIFAYYDAAETDKVVALGDALRDIDDEKLDAIEALADADLAEKEKLDAIAPLEQLVLYQRWILAFANNFISMPDLYNMKKRALFERGDLVLAGRLFTLAVLVPDRAAHAAAAAEGTMFLAYVKVEAPNESFEVAVPVTYGNSVGIVPGKRGVFRDTNGKEYDAIVTQIIKQPVSLWEAATAPFSKIAKFISTKLQALGESGDKSMDTAVASADKAAPAAPVAPPAPGAAPAPAASPLGGTIAAGGVALAAIGSAVAVIMNQLRALSALDILRATIAITILIMAPSALLGWLKLRRRNLAIVLEGAGWALNDRLLLTRRLGRLFTRRPPRPAGSTVDRSDLVPSLERDEDEEGMSGWVILLIVVLIAALAYTFREPLIHYLKLLLPQAPAPAPAPSASASVLVPPK